MKICNYCNAENDDNAKTCSACGAKEFSQKCNNCGTIYKDALYCPKCGTKAGQKAKTCPNCGTEYYTNACPNCGFTGRTSNNASVEVNVKYAEKPKKRKTWLWVLGWIFIFPLPLTILIHRNQKMAKGLKIAIIAAAWIAYLCIGYSNKSDKTADKPNAASEQISESVETVSNTEAEDSISNDADLSISENKYADDPVVNRFITEFNNKTPYEIAGISKGNIRTKYFGYANNRYLEMINANDAAAEAFALTIYGGKEESYKESMYQVFREAVKILDSTVSDEMIDTAIQEFEDKNVLIEGYTIGDSISVTYCPLKELSYGKTTCRVDILASNYK